MLLFSSRINTTLCWSPSELPCQLQLSAHVPRNRRRARARLLDSWLALISLMSSLWRAGLARQARAR